LKPVHRRILYAMGELGLEPSKPYRKSAKIVGDTMGKYHPHGDSSIYQAMVRLAQDFSTRYPLVDGHGNFGSVDGDGAAAQRYTEARLSKLSMEMLSDINKNTVDFIPNYDETDKEPTVLPARIPNLLINGSSGIAVGMATNIPPHNLTETLSGAVKMIENRIADRETSVSELMEFIKGPDFPTGGTILGKSGIRSYFNTGRGKLTVRANAVIETTKNGREVIIIDEIPYQVNKAKMLEKIGELVHEKRIEGISDMRDESARGKMRIVIEIRRDANANVVLNKLFKYTQLQESFGVIMLALSDGKPVTLNLCEALEKYLDHQEDVVRRRTVFDLDRAEKRAHLLEGFLIALDNIDEVIHIIRTSYDNAKERLMERFGFSEVQAQAILDMRLRRLQGLERERLQNEYNELLEKIAYFKSILADHKLLLGVVRDELIEMRGKYPDERRTRIAENPGEIDDEDLIDEETVVITLSGLNYVKRMPLMLYRSQDRGGRGIKGMQTRDEDYVRDLFLCSTHDMILFFTSFGRVFRCKAYEIPEAGRNARGTALINLIELSSGEKISAVMPLSSFMEEYSLVMVTKKGLVKKSPLMSYMNIRKGGLLAIALREDDELISVMLIREGMDVFIASRKGMGIRFSISSVRTAGRVSMGVRAITLRDDDYVIGAVSISPGDKILNVTELGYGKRSEESEYRPQNRGGLGLIAHRLTEKTGELAGITLMSDEEELMLITSEGTVIRLRGREISTLGRASQGVKLMNLAEGVSVTGVAKINREDIEDEETDVTEEINEAEE
ncbi:MAG: DNA gyrase subunit A, partial [Firmicutes bacterium]|nr:DNA gyrase subunit A [Bacillota bacterium]